MKFALLIFYDVSLFPVPGSPEHEPAVAEYVDFTQRIREAGSLVGWDVLDGPQSARKVSARSGKPRFTDGPFIETKEQLAGFYVIEAPNVKMAAEWAAGIPAAKLGTVEVRPIVDHGDA